MRWTSSRLQPRDCDFGHAQNIGIRRAINSYSIGSIFGSDEAIIGTTGREGGPLLKLIEGKRYHD